MLLTETDNIKLRENLKGLTAFGEHQITFYKADGTKRTLKATRDSTIISETLGKPYEPKVSNRSEPTTSLSVFDVDAGIWKSFKFESLIEIDGINKDILLKQSGIELL